MSKDKAQLIAEHLASKPITKLPTKKARGYDGQATKNNSIKYPVHVPYNNGDDQPFRG